MKSVDKYILGATLCAIIISILCTSCSPCLAGYGQTVTKEYNSNDFSEVEIGGFYNNLDFYSGLDANISPSDGYSISITMPQNVAQYLEVSKSMQTLKIGLRTVCYSGDRPVATIRMPDLKGVSYNAGSRGKVSGFKLSNDLNVVASGGSNINLDIQAADINMDVSGGSYMTGHIAFTNAKLVTSGGSTAELAGSGDCLTVSGASGGSQIRLPDITVKNADIIMSGGSQAELSVSENLGANLSGGSTLHYKGNPRIVKQVLTGLSEMARE